jgi:uncharacterized repeat protein (TIGR01451 family)
MINRRRGPRALLSILALVAGMLAIYVQPVNATLQLLKPTASDPATFSGKGGYSADGLGQAGTGGTVQAQVPAGSTVVQAYLYGTYYGTVPGGPPLEDRTIDFDGTTVVLEWLPNSEPGTSGLATARASVTAQVATKVGSGGGITDFAVNTDPTQLDGVALVVLFSNATLPEVTIAVLDGGSKQSGDQVTFTFASPINPTAPGFSAIMSLGSGYSYQSGAVSPHDCSPSQFSIVKVNSAPLTACAGNWDDGVAANGGLITVGGVGDSIDNPADPENQTGTDDELYNLVPLMKNGDSALVIDTSNPSGDDNLFLAVIQVTAKASVTTEICGNGLDDDGDGLIDTADPDCTADVSVTKTDSPDPVTVGQELTYTITAANAGPSAAQGVTVSDTLPATVTFVSAISSQGSCSGTATVSCALGALASGGSATVTIKVTPTTDADLSNTATVASTTADPSSTNNTDTELTVVDPVPVGGPCSLTDATTTVERISPPPSVKLNRLTSNECVRLFDERQDVTLTRSLKVDISAPGTVERKKDLTPFSIPAGTVVDSHFLHADNVGKAKVRLQGSVTFDADIIGVIITDNNLDASDRLGAVGTRYPNDLKRRGLELPSVRRGGDLVTLSADLRTLTFDVAFPSVLDQIRVITANAPPSISIGDVRVTEGNRSTKLATFRVRLAYVSGQPVTVGFTTKDGNALQPSDYTATAGTLTFPPGTTEMTVGVPVVGDTVRESNETFTVELSGAVNATIADAVGLGTIIDNDNRDDHH